MERLGVRVPPLEPYAATDGFSIVTTNHDWKFRLLLAAPKKRHRSDQFQMASKTKNSKTYVVHQNGNFRERTVIGRFLVGAKNPKQAEEFLRDTIGKHTKVRVYYEEKNKLVSYGEVIRQC